MGYYVPGCVVNALHEVSPYFLIEPYKEFVFQIWLVKDYIYALIHVLYVYICVYIHTYIYAYTHTYTNIYT